MKQQPSTNCMKLVEQAEGFRSQSYLCPAKVWTIGYGTTKYPTGNRVMPDERCTKGEAEVYMMHDLLAVASEISAFITAPVNQNQFDALVSFAYNLGAPALKGSTLLKLVNLSVNNPIIRHEFDKWVHGGGKVLPGLVTRRKAEADLYFTK